MNNQLLSIKKISTKGFTLVELMVVIAIIAVLATVALTLFTNAQQSSRNSKRRADLQAIANAMESHYNATANQYCAGAAGSYCANQNNWFTGAAGNAVPTDTGGGAYCYQNGGNGQMANTAGGCANGWAAVAAGANPADGVVGGWSICASLEPFAAGNQVYCIHNQQQ